MNNVFYQIDIKPELPDEVKILQVIFAGFVVGAGVRLQLDVGWKFDFTLSWINYKVSPRKPLANLVR